MPAEQVQTPYAFHKNKKELASLAESEKNVFVAEKWCRVKVFRINDMGRYSLHHQHIFI